MGVSRTQIRFHHVSIIYHAYPLVNHTGIGPYEWTSLNDASHETLDYFKLPHPEGPESNCGTPFSKAYLPLIESGKIRFVWLFERGCHSHVLCSSPYPEAREALDKAIACSYWASSQDRIKSQWALWQDEFSAKTMMKWNGPEKTSTRCGVILPQVVPAGTVTRRAVERTWLTGKFLSLIHI